MHLLTILVFAFLFWRQDQPPEWVLVGADQTVWIIAAASLLPFAITLGGWWAVAKANRLANNPNTGLFDAHMFHHRATTALRTVTGLTFAALVFLTAWPELVRFGATSPSLQIVGDLVTLAPFFASVIGLWIVSYPLEGSMRRESLRSLSADGQAESVNWSFARYLDFQVRHHLLIVAVPMTIILFAANMTRGYEDALRSATGWVWAPDACLGGVALLVFLTAPILLRRIWRTEPLPPGPVRERLEALCRRINLRFREILIWKSDGMMINAAVMGVFAPVRYVLLSDALLATMSPQQIEAVFGHEAGHIRRRHMQHFLLFALVGWFIVAGLMELIALTVADPARWWGNPGVVIQLVGVLATVAFWGIGFGWLSRKFERQADLFGARCVMPTAQACRFPCSVHLDSPPPAFAAARTGEPIAAGTTESIAATRTVEPIAADVATDRDQRSQTEIRRAQPLSSDRVCATGAMVFASALDRVAVLNGIPHEEKSWRHPSIAGRMRFLASLSGDPTRAEAFERNVRRLTRALFALAVIGALATGLYLLKYPEPAVLRLQVGTL